jgi:hypothetical protein
MYRLIRFGVVSLEECNQVDDVGSGETPLSYLSLPEGGALDNFSGTTKHPGLVDRLVARTLTASTPSALTQKYMTLLALRGRRDKLHRSLVSGENQWMYARLVALVAQRHYERAQFGRLQEIEMRMACQETYWRGEAVLDWLLDDGFFLDEGLNLDAAVSCPLTASPVAIEVSLGTGPGRAPVRSILIRVTAPATGALSNITIARADGETLVFGGSVAASKVLQIDTGTMQVKNDGVDAYDDLTLSPTADMAAWFTLLPGDNQITVTYTGNTGGSVEFGYYEAWY